MARKVKPLSDVAIKNGKMDDFPLFDGGGLFIDMSKKGAKLWRFKYARPYTKKRNTISLGAYPDVTLAQARAKREEYSALLAANIDPQEQRRQEEQEKADSLNRTFERMAAMWFEDRKNKANFSERTARDTWALFERHLLRLFGSYPLDKITPLIAINALKPLERAGKLETVRKLIGNINNVMRYALHRGLIAHNPLSEISKEFDKPAVKGMKTIEPEELGEFLTGLYSARDNNRFSPISFYAVMLVLLTGGRPSEIARAKWADIDLQGQIWAYRVQKGNKNLPEGRLHTVTLSRQAVAIFKKMKSIHNALNIKSHFVFYSERAKEGHLTIEAIRQAVIKGMGKDRLTTHGIRHLISTALNDRNYKADWIEQALSHKDKNRIRGTYNKAKYLEQRAAMLQEWADYIETLTPSKIT